MPDEPLGTFSEEHELDDVVGSTPQQFANLEAAQELGRERRKSLIDKLLRRRPPTRPAEPPGPSEAELLHELAVEEKAEFPHHDAEPTAE